jgi:serine/threonine protein kinase
VEYDIQLAVLTPQKLVANRKEFVDELALLANLSHPNIVQFLGAVTTQRPMVMVTEYLPKVRLG